MRYLIAVAVVLICGCTAKVPAYEGEGGESTVWVNLYGDTTKDMCFFINYENGQVVPTIAFYQHPDSMKFLQQITVFIEDYRAQDSVMQFVYGEFPGTAKFVDEASTYASVRDTVIKNSAGMDSSRLSFHAERRYVVSAQKLPDVLNLTYEVTTASGKVSGVVAFRKTERTVEQPMRFH
ncbi:MAG TPA: hypothetical protein VK826_08745 [Bacteroidia bacterium]|nr:hypothetical protein [Bacteroidia bacterium]